VAYYGVPVILDVPGIGYAELSEDEYARLYKQLSSSEQEQVDAATASLQAIKAAAGLAFSAIEKIATIAPIPARGSGAKFGLAFGTS
jgi:hypothetical protein